MKPVTFVTGNEHKAKYFSELIGLTIPHEAVDMHEIQSLDLREIVSFKLDEAYIQLQKPVLVEDVSLEFTVFGRLPGTFIKWFLEEMSYQEICDLVPEDNRSVTAKCVMGYFDGKEKVYFEGAMPGTVPQKPTGDKGFGWDPIFIPEGYDVTRAELSPEDDIKTYKTVKPIDAIRTFLLS